MFIEDTIYGQIEVTGVLEALINSDAVQRLKKIHQGGASFLVNPLWSGTRYEHSVGVMLLIKLYGGSIEEQIAGLLHDVSHTAFSHVSDKVFDRPGDNYHEEIFNDVVMQSTIPQILTDFGYDVHTILDDIDQWTLLEQSAPALCADRIDYTLRDVHHYQQLPLEEIQWFLQQLTVHEGKFCVKTIKAAEWFTAVYYKEVVDYFMNPVGLYAGHELASILREAVDDGVISERDFLGNDQHIIKQLEDRLYYADKLNRLKQGDMIKNRTYQLKVRLIDPDALADGKLYRASTLSPHVKQMTMEAEERQRKDIN